MYQKTVPLALVCLVLFSGPAHAQHVYKCVNGRDVSYQSAPCLTGQRLARQWEASPEPAPTAEMLAAQRLIQVQGERESAYLRSLARGSSRKARSRRPTGAVISAARDGGRCAKAKKRRDDTERRLGLKRTFESMQRLSAMVSEACR